MVSEIKADFDVYGYFGGAGREWINFLFMLGGVYLLLVRGVIKWQIPVAVLAGVFHPQHGDPAPVRHGYAYASPLFHLFSGGTMLCAFFIATDPVTASTTEPRAPHLRWLDRNTDLPDPLLGDIPRWRRHLRCSSLTSLCR